MKRTLIVAASVVALLVVGLMPAAAQQTPATPLPNTITVIGTGTSNGAPDTAMISIGADVANAEVQPAFAQANATVQAIIDAMTEGGVAPEDIRTNNLSVYVEAPFGPEGGERLYRVSNTVEVVVRNVENIEALIDAAITAGATNIYGLSFYISDQSTLETEARAAAVEDARTRAAELAGLVGAELGDAIAVTETPSYFNPFGPVAQAEARGGGGAVVVPGQSSVQVQLTVTYAINR